MPPNLRRALLLALALGAIFGSLVGCSNSSAPAGTYAPPAAAPAAQPSGPSAQDVADQLSALFPTPNPRDNTGACAPACTELITTDAVSVYQWKDEATAKKFAGASTDVDVVGPFALSYKGREQQATSRKARAAYRAKVGEMLSR